MGKPSRVHLESVFSLTLWGIHHALRGMVGSQAFMELSHENSEGVAMSEAKHAEYDAVRDAFYHSLSLHIVETSGLQVEAHSIEYSALEQTLDWDDRLYQWS